MNLEVWKENTYTEKSSLSLLEYLETISAGHPDPLAAYVPYIKDAKTNLLQPVLNKFLNNSQYKNDNRYLKLWIIYADSTERPEDIYKYLIGKNVGNYSSLLHVALADVYESYSWHDQAELVYLKAIINKAEPFHKLTECYNKFKTRTEGKPRYRQDLSVEEFKSIPRLRELAGETTLTPTVSPHTTPVVQKSQSRINLSAFKNTPELDNLYHSPYDQRIDPKNPILVNGRLPLSLI